eukprot:156113_1
MIQIGSDLLEKNKETIIHLMLQCFSYFDIFYTPKTDQPMLSLINYVSGQAHANSLQSILFKTEILNKDDHKAELAKRNNAPEKKKKEEKKTKEEKEEKVKMEQDEDEDEDDDNATILTIEPEIKEKE